MVRIAALERHAARIERIAALIVASAKTYARFRDFFDKYYDTDWRTAAKEFARFTPDNVRKAFENGGADAPKAWVEAAANLQVLANFLASTNVWDMYYANTAYNAARACGASTLDGEMEANQEAVEAYFADESGLLKAMYKTIGEAGYIADILGEFFDAEREKVKAIRAPFNILTSAVEVVNENASRFLDGQLHQFMRWCEKGGSAFDEIKANGFFQTFCKDPDADQEKRETAAKTAKLFAKRLSGAMDKLLNIAELFEQEHLKDNASFTTGYDPDYMEAAAVTFCHSFAAALDAVEYMFSQIKYGAMSENMFDSLRSYTRLYDK